MNAVFYLSQECGFSNWLFSFDPFWLFSFDLEWLIRFASNRAQAWTDFVAEGKKGKTLEEFEKELDS